MAWGVTANITPESGIYVSGHQAYNAIASVLATHAGWEAVDSFSTGANTIHVWKNLASVSGLPLDWYMSFYHDNAYGVLLYGVMHEKYTVGTRTAEWYMPPSGVSFTPVYDSTTQMWHCGALSVFGGTQGTPAVGWRLMNTLSTNLMTVQTLVTNDSIVYGISGSAINQWGTIGKYDSWVNRVPDPMPLAFVAKASNDSYSDQPVFSNAPGASAVASAYWMDYPTSQYHSPMLRQIPDNFGTLGTVVPGAELDNFLYGVVMSRLLVEDYGGTTAASSQKWWRGLFRNIYAPYTQRTYSIGTTLLLGGRTFALLATTNLPLWVDTEAT